MLVALSDYSTKYTHNNFLFQYEIYLNKIENLMRIYDKVFIDFFSKTS